MYCFIRSLILIAIVVGFLGLIIGSFRKICASAESHVRSCCSAKNLPFPPAGAVGDFLMQRYGKVFTECALWSVTAR